MNEFLKYLKMIPVIIYPYIYVLILAVFFLFVGVLPEDTTDISLLVLLIIAVIYNLYSFVIVIVNAVQTSPYIKKGALFKRLFSYCLPSASN